jgi:SsrA-binding protein
MAQKKSNQPKKISNRRAFYDYDLGDKFVVGLVLSGAEVKSLRMGHGHLRGAYVTLKQNELWLINATIAGTSGIHISESDQTRARKILVKKRELNSLIESKNQGKSIIPIEIITSGRYIKLRIAVGKGKREYDKRQVLKARDDNRSAQQALKQHL